MTVAEKHSEIVKKGFLKRIRRNDVTITFQEWCLYYLLRAKNSDDELSEDLLAFWLNDVLRDPWYDKSWKNFRASKYNLKVVNTPWMDVFK